MEYREVRADVTLDSDGKLRGVAVPFSRETVIGDMERGGWREEFAPGAFTKSLRDGDILFLAHHDMHQPLARTSAGNLTLEAKADGLHWEADPVDTSYGRDLRALADAKVLGGVSVGFRPIAGKDDWYDDEGKPSTRQVGTKRIIREAQLIEISGVTKPAYEGTSISGRDELLAERETRQEDWAYEDSVYEENRASSVSAAGRRKAASKGHALPDGSYPIEDVAHLHAAAVLAASHHGNWKAAKALIRRRAKELGVALASLPGFGKSKKAGMKASRSADGTPVERRIRNGTAKRVVQIHADLHAAVDMLKKGDAEKAMVLVDSAREHAGHIMHKENLDAADTVGRSEQKPEPSTSVTDEAIVALREMERSRRDAESEA